jgi:hypothetical protein
MLRCGTWDGKGVGDLDFGLEIAVVVAAMLCLRRVGGNMSCSRGWNTQQVATTRD